MKLFLLLPLLYIVCVTGDKISIEEEDEDVVFCQYEEGCEEEAEKSEEVIGFDGEFFNEDFMSEDADLSSFMEMNEELLEIDEQADDANLLATGAIEIAYDAANPELYGFPSEVGFVEVMLELNSEDANLLDTDATEIYFDNGFVNEDDFPENANLVATGATLTHEIPKPEDANLLATGATEVFYAGGFVSEDPNLVATGATFPQNGTLPQNQSKY